MSAGSAPLRAVVLSHVYADPGRRGKLRALAGLGCSVGVVVPRRWIVGGREQQVEWGDDAGLRVMPLEVRGPLGEPGEVAWERSGLRRILRDFRPDLVQVEEEPWTQAAAITIRAARRLGVPGVIFTAESVPASRGFTARRRRNRVLDHAAGLLAANHVALDLIREGRGGVPAAILPQTGVAVPAAVPRPAEPGLTIGFVGRLVPERGLDLLLRACARLYGDWALFVAGSGPAQESLERLAEQLGLSSRITWLGALPAAELDRAWSRLDCLVYPARATPTWVEVTGRLPLQAMGRGIPVIATRTGALPDVVGEAGLLTPAEDIEAITTALQALQADPAARASVGEAARRRVMAGFSDAAIARRTLEFWRRVMEPGGVP